MNTGICDAVDLAWKFAAILQAGASEPACEHRGGAAPDRRAHLEASGAHMNVRFRIGEAYDPRIHEDSAEGAAAREAYGRLIERAGQRRERGPRNRDRLSLPQFADHLREGEEPEWRLLEYVPSTWPGVRAPHVVLADGAAISIASGRGSPSSDSPTPAPRRWSKPRGGAACR